MANHKPPSREFDARGLLIILLSFGVNMLLGAVYKSLGVLLPVLKEQFTSYVWLIGTVIAAISVMADITSILTNPLEKVLGTRRLLILGAILEVVGFFMVPFAPNLIVLSGALVFIMGPAFGFLNILNKVLIARHFSDHFTLACGIGHTGQVVAFAFAPMVQLFVNTYGWRGATLLLGAIFANIVPLMIVVREDKSQYQRVPHHDLEDHQSLDGSASAKHLCGRIIEATDLRMILQFKFWIICGVRFSSGAAYNAWVIYYVPHLLVKGFSPEAAANLCLPVTIGYLLGTVIWAPLVDRGVIKCSTGVIISFLILTLSFCIDPWLDNVPEIASNTFVFGLGIASSCTLGDTLVRDVFEPERLTSALGLNRGIACLPRLFAGFLPGWFYEEMGSYDLAFIVMGLSFSVALIPMFIGIVGGCLNKPTQPDV